MRPVVRERWCSINNPWEGRVGYFYADVKGLITIGVGNLVDPIGLALPLVMYRTDGVKASAQEIRDDWNAVKNNPHAAALGHRFAAKLTRLRMKDEDIDQLVLKRLDMNDKILAARFERWEDFPADAQFAAHSICWAAGPHAAFPKFNQAMRSFDFRTAAIESKMSEVNNPGLKPRNAANRQMLLNAAAVQEQGLDPSILYWPQVK